MYSAIPFRTGDEDSLAAEFIQTYKTKTLHRDLIELKSPIGVTEDTILAVHFADAGAHGDPGAVEFLCLSQNGIQRMYGNYAHGDPDLSDVIRVLPMLACVDSRDRAKPPFPLGGTLIVPEGWDYWYMGAMNHLYLRHIIGERSERFLKVVSSTISPRTAFDATAWLCGA